MYAHVRPGCSHNYVCDLYICKQCSNSRNLLSRTIFYKNYVKSLCKIIKLPNLLRKVDFAFFYTAFFFAKNRFLLLEEYQHTLDASQSLDRGLSLLEINHIVLNPDSFHFKGHKHNCVLGCQCWRMEIYPMDFPIIF